MSKPKTCTQCGQTKALDEYHRDRSRRDGLFPQCKQCRRSYSAEYSARPEVKQREKDRRASAQPGPCAIDGCNKPTIDRICSMHQGRIARHGDPSVVKEPRRLFGAANASWRGDEVGYDGAHTRVKRLKGSASGHDCSECGGIAAHWAYDHADPSERVARRGAYLVPYSTEPDHYIPLCVPCHKALDLARLMGLDPIPNHWPTAGAQS